MKRIEIDDLVLVSEKSGDTLIIRWMGKSKEMDPGAKLIPVINELLNEVKTDLLLDFLELEYINSSSVIPILEFLKAADVKSINTVIHYDPQISWQKAMFRAVANLARLLKHLTVKEITPQ